MPSISRIRRRWRPPTNFHQRGSDDMMDDPTSIAIRLECEISCLIGSLEFGMARKAGFFITSKWHRRNCRRGGLCRHLLDHGSLPAIFKDMRLTQKIYTPSPCVCAPHYHSLKSSSKPYDSPYSTSLERFCTHQLSASLYQICPERLKSGPRISLYCQLSGSSA